MIVLRNALIGAGVGAGVGGLYGAVSDDTSVLGGMIGGAALGAAGAAAYKHFGTAENMGKLLGRSAGTPIKELTELGRRGYKSSKPWIDRHIFNTGPSQTPRRPYSAPTLTRKAGPAVASNTPIVAPPALVGPSLESNTSFNPIRARTRTARSRR